MLENRERVLLFIQQKNNKMQTTLKVADNNKMTLVTVLLYVFAAITLQGWAAIFALLAAATTFILNMVKLIPIAKERFQKWKARKRFKKK
jgi:hypothetical protein